MRACATASAVASGFALTAVVFLACSSGGGTPQPPPTPDNVAPPTSVAPPPASASSAPKEDTELAHCREVMASADGPVPEGGVVMNNAMTSADHLQGAMGPVFNILALVKPLLDIAQIKVAIPTISPGADLDGLKKALIHDASSRMSLRVQLHTAVQFDE